MKRTAELLMAAGLVTTLAGIGFRLYSGDQQRRARLEWRIATSASRSVDGAASETPSNEIAGRLFFPRLNQEVFVFKGSEKENLKRGPVWLEVTARPGSRGNSVIAGHRDTHFRFLKDVIPGEQVLFDQGKETYSFRVSRLKVVKPSDRELLAPASKGLLKLVTCYPFYHIGPSPRRYIVQAEFTGSSSYVIGKLRE